MVAELLRLKGRMLLNGFRRPLVRIFGSTVLLGIALAGLIWLFVRASRVVPLDGDTLGRVAAVGGADIALGALLLPIMFSRMQLLEPRAFLGYGIRSPALAGLILLATLLGPALLLVPLVLVPVVAWRHFDVAGLAWGVAPLLLLQLLLLIRVGVAIGAGLRRHQRTRVWLRVVGVLLMLGGLLTLFALLLPRVMLVAPRPTRAPLATLTDILAPFRAEHIADRVAALPFGSLWGAPAIANSGVGDTRAAVWIGVATIVVLALLWWALVAAALRPTRALHLSRAVRMPGWFRGLPTTPAGAVAARSFIYWVRDPRYRVVFGILPLLPIVTVIAFWIGGVPKEIAAFVPLPLVVVVLAWSTIHNDIAYDSTAMWSHLSAQMRGVHDRLGRIWPVIAFGAVVVAIGTPVTVYFQGSAASLPAVLGINIALLLGGVGVGSGMSSRHPYPAPRPGDGGFTYPQASGGTGGGAQGGSFLLTILVGAPPIAATVLWLMGFAAPWPGQWTWPWIALVAGIASGLVALLIGVRAGGSAFDRRGPELLAFTMQN